MSRSDCRYVPSLDSAVVLAMAVMLIGQIGFEVQARSAEPPDFNKIMQKLDAANSQSPPEHGKADYRYQHWTHPRYITKQQYEADLAARIELKKKEASDTGATDLQQRLDAELVNTTFTLMNDTYEDWKIVYYFDGPKKRADRTLSGYTSRLEEPSYAKGNPHVHINVGNSSQVAAWNGQFGLRQSDIGKSRWVATYDVSNSPPGIVSPPIMVHNAPELAVFSKQMDLVGIEEVQLNGIDQYKVTFTHKDAPGKRMISIYYRTADGSFLSTDSQETGATGEVGRYSARFSTEREPVAGLPREVEFAMYITDVGREERVVDKQLWTLERFESEAPADADFTPKLGQNVVEVAAFVDGKETFRALDTDRSTSFLSFLDVIERSGPTSVQVAPAWESWKKERNLKNAGASGASEKPQRSQKWVWLVGLNVVVLIAVICRTFFWRGARGSA